MKDPYERLNKYERAYVRSRMRKRSSLHEKRSLWDRIKRFFFLDGRSSSFNRTPRIIDVEVKSKKKNNNKGKSTKKQETVKTTQRIAAIHESVNVNTSKKTNNTLKTNKNQEPSPQADMKESRTKKSHNKTKAKSTSKKKTKNKKDTSKKNKKVHHHILSFSKKVIIALALLFLVAAGSFGIWFSTLEIPNVDTFEERKISSSTKIYDRTGEIILYDIHENIQRQVVSLDTINQNAIDAIVAIEDENFYEHNGVVWKSTLRGAFQSLLSVSGLSNEGTSGGSTITQQVVKNTLLNSQKRISRKAKEWVLAYKIEQRLSKDEILEIYLNEAPYGGTIYGIQEASRVFFGISASELSIAQAAYLAAIPNRPTYYSPYGENTQQLRERAQTVLWQMKNLGYINDEDYRTALEEEVEFLNQEDNASKALHFVQYIRAYLEETYGTDLVETGGLNVVTTLDYELQQKAEEIIKNHVEDVEEQYDASNAGLVAIEPTTGQIITMVGSRDYFSEDIEGNFNVVLAQRQPGSAFKPLAYAQAFSEGYLPETALFDTRTQFNTRCEADDMTSADGCYSPNNYDSLFKGPMSMRQALAQSRNIPAVKTAYLAGISDVMRLASDLGITSLNQAPDFYGLGLVLGGGEVSLLELTSAYGVFANDGFRNKPTGILSVTDAEGNELEVFEKNENKVMSSNSARMISDILSDNLARTPLFGSRSFLYFGNRDVAAKTGTTNDNRDAWLIGYNPNIAVGVWTGNNDNSPMRRGSSISGQPWRAFMDEALEKYDDDDFNDYDLPDDFSAYPQMVQGNWESGQTQTIVIEDENGEEQEVSQQNFNPHTLLHWVDKSDPTVLSVTQSDTQYENWEYSVQQYVNENYQERLNEIIFEEEGDGSGEPRIPSDFDIIIEGIRDGDIFDNNDRERISVSFQGIDEDDIDEVQFKVNGVNYDSDDSDPFNSTLDLEDIDNLRSFNILTVTAINSNEESNSLGIGFNVEF